MFDSWEKSIKLNIKQAVKEARRKALESSMIKTLKYRSDVNCRFFVTSDTHFNHNKDFVYAARGFNSIQAHNEGLINKINERVKENDTLFHLGDFCLNSTEEDFENFLSRINCRNIYFIWGNHNHPLEKIYRREVKKLWGGTDVEVYPLRYKNIVFWGSYQEVIIDDKFCVLSHYPIKEFNHMKHGAYMLCGHSHGGNPISQKASTDGLYLDCGWDEHGAPLLFSEVVAIMDGKKKTSIGHH